MCGFSSLGAGAAAGCCSCSSIGRAACVRSRAAALGGLGAAGCRCCVRLGGWVLELLQGAATLPLQCAFAVC